MSKVNNPIEVSFDYFVQGIYRAAPKPVLFWDTCALLDILRLPYRKGTIDSFRLINQIKDLIQNDQLFSVASALTIKEWNEHENKILTETQKSLELTELFHGTCIAITNDVYGATYVSEPISNKSLCPIFENLAENILSKTFFLETAEIANSALTRISDKLPPASKKNEFKDCAIWETVLKMSRDIYDFDQHTQQVFFTVNTEDFFDKGRTPNRFYPQLLTEAAMSNLACCSSVLEVKASLNL